MAHPCWSFERPDTIRYSSQIVLTFHSKSASGNPVDWSCGSPKLQTDPKSGCGSPRLRTDPKSSGCCPHPMKRLFAFTSGQFGERARCSLRGRVRWAGHAAAPRSDKSTPAGFTSPKVAVALRLSRPTPLSWMNKPRVVRPKEGVKRVVLGFLHGPLIGEFRGGCDWAVSIPPSCSCLNNHRSRTVRRCDHRAPGRTFAFDFGGRGFAKDEEFVRRR